MFVVVAAFTASCGCKPVATASTYPLSTKERESYVEE